VIESGKPYLQPLITEQMVRAAARSEEHGKLIERLGLCSLLVVPMIGKNGAVGALTLATAESRRQYAERDVAFARALADRAAIAVENSRLVRALEETALAEKRAAAASSQAREALEQASRAKDEFLATMSHELRTPLHSILGWANLLREQPRDEKILEQGLEVIERNAKTQERLIGDLLDVSRIISGKLRLAVARTSLWDVVHGAADVVRPAAESKGVRLLVDIDPDLPALVADAARLQQVVWNLLINGIKFTPQGGRIVVTAQWTNSKVLLQVRDTGSGIAPEHLPHVFERFLQVDSSATRRHGGLGLGLAIVRHVVEAHGGTVEAQSDGLGHGATFTVSLPILAIDVSAAETGAPAEVAEASVSPAPRTRLDGMRILVVEDDPDALELIKRVLVAAGAQVTAAATAPAALAAPTPFDVIVSDIGMAQMDGYALMKRIRSREIGGTIPSIALTAYARAEDAERAIRAGYQEHVAKPIEPSKLVAAVARWRPRPSSRAS
jgi:signal transduction histidine kinase/ActR/RegA family two-component response regulator